MFVLFATRRVDAKKSTSRNLKISATYRINAPTIAEALDELRQTVRAADKIALGYMPVIKVEIYLAADWKFDCLKAVPVRTLDAAQIASLTA